VTPHKGPNSSIYAGFRQEIDLQTRAMVNTGSLVSDELQSLLQGGHFASLHAQRPRPPLGSPAWGSQSRFSRISFARDHWLGATTR
jgi:hypothetical protein